eukprot:7278294-Lingulodinium_polyedra.AAC.1
MGGTRTAAPLRLLAAAASRAPSGLSHPRRRSYPRDRASRTVDSAARRGTRASCTHHTCAAASNT